MYPLRTVRLARQFAKGLSGWPMLCRGWSALLLLGAVSLAQAQAIPSNAYNYSRTSAFSYQANGLLATETVEPDSPQLCVSTTYSYDAYGNKTGATTANCAGASGLALVDQRSSSSLYASQSVTVAGVSVTIPSGSFATSAVNALSHGESRVYDPRFGAVRSLTGPNNLTTSWTLDDYGRKVIETRADGTKTATYHCWLKVYNPATGALDAANTTNAPSNSAGCHNGSNPVIPAPLTSPVAEAPADAVRYEHSVTQGTNGSAIAAYVRIYYDRAGRKLRSITQAFDGSTQPGGTARLIAQDTDYNAYGTAYVSTQPYFLDSGSSTTGGSGDVGLTLTEFDALGRPTAVYTTDRTTTGQLGGNAGTVVFGNRSSRQAAKTSISYEGLNTTTVNDKNQARIEEKNLEGQIVRVTDALGAQVVHQYDAFGNLAVTKDALGNQVAITYDVRGRKVVLNDPDAGVTAYCYDALGQLKAQQTSNQRGGHSYTPGTCPSVAGTGTTAPAVAGWTTLAYDLLGRMTSRAEPEYTSTWAYDSCTKGTGKLCSSSTSHGITKTLVYDTLGRPINSRTDVLGGPSLASAVAYDATTGRASSQTYPTGVKLSYLYTAKGYLQTVRLDTAATVNPLPATPGGTPGASASIGANTALWQANAVNAWGKSEQHAYANGINNRAVFEPQSGRLTNLSAGPNTTSTAVDQRYTWDSTNMLTQRVDAVGDGSSGIQVADTFQYDSLGRLTQYQVSGSGTPSARTVTLQYNALGMMLTKSDVGNYSYPTQGTVNGKPHAVQSVSGIGVAYSYDLNGNAVTASGGKWRSMAYTSFNLPDGTNGIAGPAGTPRSTWQYDENHQRIKEVRSNGQGTRTTWYLHPDNQGGLGFEREVAANGSLSNRHYISAGGTSIAVLVTTGALPVLATGQTAPADLTSVTAVKLEYWHKDQLGSLIATTDHNGTVTGRYAYDPFGKRRYTNSTYDAFGALVVDWTTDTNTGTDRGYTGHEHLDDLGLVHMNGRIFDPNIARFLQADPFIQDPNNLQNFDRFAYCFNNPLVCTDPSGYFSLSKLWKKIRPFVGIVVAIYLGPGAAIWDTGNALAGLGNMIGPIGQSAFAGFASGAVSSGSIKGALQGAFSGAAFGGVGQIVHSGVHEVVAVMLHGVAGCVTAEASGGKCGAGALSASFAKAASFLPGMGEITENARRGETVARFEGTLISAVIGGTASVLGGGKFANGAQTGAFGYLFNQLSKHYRDPRLAAADRAAGIDPDRSKTDAAEEAVSRALSTPSTRAEWAAYFDRQSLIFSWTGVGLATTSGPWSLTAPVFVFTAAGFDAASNFLEPKPIKTTTDVLVDLGARRVPQLGPTRDAAAQLFKDVKNETPVGKR